jgi:hypothetical protein
MVVILRDSDIEYEVRVANRVSGSIEDGARWASSSGIKLPSEQLEEARAG